MRKQYTVKPDNSEFVVIEEKYGLKIKKCKTKSEANKIRNKLNSGCGFMGHTPPFFALKG